MTTLSLAAVAEASRATLEKPDDQRAAAPPLTGLSTDSRRLQPGNLFVALRGPNYDGHAFAAAAVAAGAAALLVERSATLPSAAYAVPRLRVDSPLGALGEIGAWWRRAAPRGGRPVVAVTGSNGKTTSKELLLAALGGKGRPVHGTRGNLNSLIGLPLTLLAWPTEAWAAVLEMGMNAPGEIDRLAQIAGPTVGLITNVNRAHLGGAGLGTLQAIARAKCELLARLPADGTAVLNADDALLQQTAAPLLAGRRVLRFGRDAAADVSWQALPDAAVAPGSQRLRLRLLGAWHQVDLALLGAHNAQNAAGAAAAALALQVEPAAIVAGLQQMRGTAGRLQLHHLAALNITLVDDTYNANPDSMQAAFAALASRPGRRLAVLGDMFELGETAPLLHDEVGAAAAAAGFAALFALGPLSAQTAAGGRRGGAVATAFGDDLPALVQALRDALQPGDWLLVKGSRGMRMERVVQALLQGVA